MWKLREFSIICLVSGHLLSAGCASHHSSDAHVSAIDAVDGIPQWNPIEWSISPSASDAASEVVLHDERDVEDATALIKNPQTSVDTIQQKELDSVVRLLTFPNGSKVVWKSPPEPIRLLDEIMYRLDKDVLRFRIIPATRWVSNTIFGNGFITKYIEHVPCGSDIEPSGPSCLELFSAAASLPQGWRVALFDLLFEYWDRYEIGYTKNGMVMADGRSVALDNGHFEFPWYKAANGSQSVWYVALLRSQQVAPRIVQEDLKALNQRAITGPQLTAYLKEIYELRINPEYRKDREFERFADEFLCNFYGKIDVIMQAGYRIPTKKQIVSIGQKCASKGCR